MLKYFCVFLVLFFGFYPTGYSQKSTAKKIETIKIDLKNQLGSVSHGKVFKVKNVSILETNSKCHIGNIDKVLVKNDQLYILDKFSSKSVFHFKSNGRFAEVVGVFGKGPGEYTMPYDIALDGENLLILDNGARILNYDLNGTYNSTKLFDNFTARNLAASENFYYLIGGGRGKSLLITNKDLVIKESYFPFVNRLFSVNIPVPLQRINADLCIYRSYLNDTIFSISKDKLDPHLYVDFGKRKTPYKSLNNSNVEIGDFEDLQSHYCIISYYFESISWVYFAFSFEQEVYLDFYNKVTKQNYLIPFSNFKNDLSFCKDSYIIGCDPLSNSFIFLVEPFTLIKELKNMIEEVGNDELKAIYKKNINDLNEISNPILIFVEPVFDKL
jgi:hypothetical protein